MLGFIGQHSCRKLIDESNVGMWSLSQVWRSEDGNGRKAAGSYQHSLIMRVVI